MYKIKKVTKSVVNSYRDFNVLYPYGFGSPNSRKSQPCTFNKDQADAVISALEETEFVESDARATQFSYSPVERENGPIATYDLRDESADTNWTVTLYCQLNHIFVEVEKEFAFNVYSAETILRHTGVLVVNSTASLSADFVANLQDIIWKVF